MVSFARRMGYAIPVVLSVQLDGQPDGKIFGSVSCTGSRAVRVASSTTDYPTAATTEAETCQALNADGTLAVGLIDTIDPGDILYVSVLAYENSDGTGSVAAAMGQRRIERWATRTKKRRTLYSQFSPVVNTPATYTKDSTEGYGYVTLHADGGTADCELFLPAGAVATDLVMSCDSMLVDFEEIVLTLWKGIGPDTPAVLAQAIGSDTTGYEEFADAFSEDVTEGESYRLTLFMRSPNDVTFNKFAWCDVTYESEGEYVTY